MAVEHCCAGSLSEQPGRVTVSIQSTVQVEKSGEEKLCFLFSFNDLFILQGAL